ncbi:MAG: hypothetical protein AAF658_09820, partial [Myxococcota bacterium]
MSDVRFGVGDSVMCNLGPDGWKLGRVIALQYREDDWPAGQVAPYQVLLEADRALIYVPEDDARYCRETTAEDLRIAQCLDALAPFPIGIEGTDLASKPIDTINSRTAVLGCAGSTVQPGGVGYRDGRCQGCDCCPQSWSYAELYSEHYRCATRNGLEVTRHTVDLGTFRVGDALDHSPDAGLPRTGFLQCPTRVRLPPGVRILDDGALKGQVEFDPHRASTYRVQLVAVSAASWETPSVGLVRLEITFDVQDNVPPPSFDLDVLTERKRRARAKAEALYRDLVEAWEAWEDGVLNHRDTCERMCARLQDLRALLEEEPRLDGGWWWVQLGGFHMNVHKLLENTLFECELYLGHALTFGDPRGSTAGRAKPRGLLPETETRSGAVPVDRRTRARDGRRLGSRSANAAHRRPSAGRMGLGGEQRGHLDQRGRRAAGPGPPLCVADVHIAAGPRFSCMCSNTCMEVVFAYAHLCMPPHLASQGRRKKEKKKRERKKIG